MSVALILGLAGPASAAPPAIPSEATARSQLAALTVRAPGSMSGYSRDRFPHWRSQPGGCDTRDRVLERDGTQIQYGSGCNVVGGRWVSPYDGGVWTDPADVDIDHIVPLAEAWRSGAASWTDSRRGDFANDMSGPQLIAVTDNVNQSKGDQPPHEWQPPLTGYWCTYARMWIGTKSRWGLSIVAAERTTLTQMLDRC
ncbi:hypothetical protein BJF78_05250 [Pseudonocardia sp. CNS-139]|nr:hypothetical protein BJF78_05250 [Pseudonocardia sp. CNS-139]